MFQYEQNFSEGGWLSVRTKTFLTVQTFICTRHWNSSASLNAWFLVLLCISFSVIRLIFNLDGSLVLRNTSGLEIINQITETATLTLTLITALLLNLSITLQSDRASRKQNLRRESLSSKISYNFCRAVSVRHNFVINRVIIPKYGNNIKNGCYK